MVSAFPPADPLDLQRQADLYRRLANMLVGDSARDLRRLATELERRALEAAPLPAAGPPSRAFPPMREGGLPDPSR